MADQHGDAYHAWRASLYALISDAPRLARWQEQRFQFAHQVGELLTKPYADSPATTGPVLYGVFLSGARLCYVGQTQEAGRRLRDLPVGESHHLANTVPPELWERVVVLRWPDLLSKAPAHEQRTATDLGFDVCSLVLEYLLQVKTSPPLNSRRRNRDGDWRPRNHAQSRSRGAIHSHALPCLWQLTWMAWQDLATSPNPVNGELLITTSAGRVAFPATSLDCPSTE